MRSGVFVYLVALIMVVGSERFFWFWTTSVTAQFEGAAFYGIATAAGLALMRRYHVTDWWSLLLVAPVIGFVVEGVITSVIYSGGPFVPLFPAWFSFWHGIMAFGGLVFGLRHLVLHRSKWATAAASAGLGLFWGLWSITLWLPENVNDPELLEAHPEGLHVLDPAEFGLYAVVMTALLVAAHGLIGFVWPTPGETSGRSGRLGVREWLVIALCLAMAVVWTVTLPWALPMFLAYCLLQIVALRWHRASTTTDEPSLFDRLQGKPGAGALAPLMLMAPLAAGTYQVLWALSPSQDAVRVFMYGAIALQVVVGLVLGVMSFIRARRSSGDEIGQRHPDPILNP